MARIRWENVFLSNLITAMVRPLILSIIASALLEGQFFAITAPGDGADLYYSFNITSPGGADLYYSLGSIYKIGSMPAELFLSFPPPVFPGTVLAGATSVQYLSPYYLASRPQFSRDSKVFAFTRSRVCLGGSQCRFVDFFETTVEGVPGKDPMTFEGLGWLSGNGRYLLLYLPFVLGTGSVTRVDLETGQKLNGFGDVDVSAAGRVIADDGTSMYADWQSIMHGVLRPAPGSGAVIDSTGHLVVYSAFDKESSSRVLRIYRPVEDQDSPFVSIGANAVSPAISADGTRVMFLAAKPPGVSELYVVNIDGTGLRQVTDDPIGVTQYAMSDDGQVAWYVAGDGSFVKLDIGSGRTNVFRVPDVDLSSTLVPGSAVTLRGVNLTDTSNSGVQVALNDAKPLLLSVSPSTIVFQVPWEIPVGQKVDLQVTTRANSSSESRVHGAVTPVLREPAFVVRRAIHDDWRGFVTIDDPARLGEVLHFYATGLGPVQPTAPESVKIPMSCNLPVLYAGLAPGFPGYYQMNIQMTTNSPYIDPFGGYYLKCDDNMSAYIWPVIP